MKKNLLVRTLAVALTAVTVLTSSVTSTNVLAKTPKALKVQSFKRTGTDNAIIMFAKPKGASKVQMRMSFYEDFRPEYTTKTSSMKFPSKGKSKKYNTTSKSKVTITTPKSGSIVSIQVVDKKLKKMIYKYQEAEATDIKIDGVIIPSNGNPDPRDTVYKSSNGYEYVGFYCAVQIRYYNNGWSKWSKSLRLNNGSYKEKLVRKELSRTEYYVCGNGKTNGCGFSVSRETVDATEIIGVHCMECPYNKYGNSRCGDLVKYSATSTWTK